MSAALETDKASFEVVYAKDCRFFRGDPVTRMLRLGSSAKVVAELFPDSIIPSRLSPTPN
jgi:hypothetical protein